MTNTLENKNKFLQYEMWKDCCIGCKFCCNKGQPDLDKAESLRFILDKLDDKEVYDYNEIGFIGGEFFNREIEDEEVRNLFYKVFEKLSKLTHVDRIYITTALIYDCNRYLLPFLDYLKALRILDKCLLCSSYDVAYRFYTEERRLLWESNVLMLHELYPELSIHTEIIVTQHFINAVLEDKFNITEFKNKFNTHVDYIEPASGLYYNNKQDCEKDIPGFFPTKESFIKFLVKTIVENKEIDPYTFCSMELRSSKLYYIDGGKRMVIDGRRGTNGVALPLDKTKKYEIGLIDSDKTMRSICQEFIAFNE